MADTATAKILNWEINVPQPYGEGHTISAIEAKVLNQTFRENVCNNVRREFKKLKDGAEDAMSVADVIAYATKYANEYEFTEASSTGRSSMTPLEKEAKKVATAVVVQKLAKQGKKRKDIEKEVFDANVARFAETEQVLKLAQANLKKQESLVENELELENVG